MKFEVNATQFLCRLFVILAMIGFLSGWLGYLFAAKQIESRQQEDHVALQHALRTEQEQVAKLQETQQHVLSLTQHIAKLEANMMRINALGGRLVKLADLDPQEFQFEHDPGVGGPMELPSQLQMPFVENLAQMLHKLEHVFDVRYQQMTHLQSVLQHRLGQESFVLGGLAKPVKKGWVSSFYGYRTDPFTGKKAWHKGVDIAGPEGAEILALASGVVTLSEEKGAYGQTVEISHGSGYVTRYGHNKRLLVKRGELVKKGQPIALMGKTGRATGPHLHLEVHKNDKAIDPGAIFSNLKSRA